METRLKKDDVIFLIHDTWELKRGQKYIVNKVFEDRHGNTLYQFKANRKNAVTCINLYAQDIDPEINEKTSSEVEVRFELVFAKSIFIVK